MQRPRLMAVPNVSSAAPGAVEALAAACDVAGAELLDVHSDRDHGRSVFTLAGPPPALVEAIVSLAREALSHADVVSSPAGQHPHVGALDVAPIVHLKEGERGSACAAALVLGERLADELSLPVLLYGELGDGRSRAELRRGGVAGLAARLASGEIAPDFGPRELHPSAGAALVAARPVLVAFNLRLAEGESVETARRAAAAIREGGERGLVGVRAIAVELGGGAAQVATNVERPAEIPLARVVAAVAELAAVESVELVGLAPRAALAGMPPGVPLVGFDPDRHVLENALGCG